MHSSTGVKLPLCAIGTALAEHNAHRSDPEPLLLVVGGVHGFGVEDDAIAALGLDFFAGTHKWILGPRGTGVVWGCDGRWSDLQPTIPTLNTQCKDGLAAMKHIAAHAAKSTAVLGNHLL